MIQCTWRSHKARKLFLKRRDEVLSAVSVIEREWTCFLDRRRRAAVVARRKQDRRRQAAVVIQATYRSFAARKKIKTAVGNVRCQLLDSLFEDLPCSEEDLGWLTSNPCDSLEGSNLEDRGSGDKQNALTTCDEAKCRTSFKEVSHQWGFKTESAAINYYKAWKRQQKQKSKKQQRQDSKDPTVSFRKLLLASCEQNCAADSSAPFSGALNQGKRLLKK